MVSKFKHSGNWSTVALGEICERIRLKNQGKTDNVLTISSQHGLVSQTEFFKKSVASKNLDGYIFLTKGDFAYNKSYSDGYPFGAIKRLDKYEQGIVSTLYLCFRPKPKVNGDFLKHYFDSNLWHGEVREIAQEGGRSHGLLNVSVDDFFGISMTIPPLAEQIEIATILSSVDDAIAATQRIIDQTEAVKRGLMQELLTKGIGHSTFKQTEIGEIPTEWDVLLLDKVTTRKSGHTPNKKIDEYWNGNIPWISLKDTYRLDKRYVYETTDSTTIKGIENSSAVLLPSGTVVVSRDATVGKVGITSQEMATSQHFINYICGAKMDNRFLYYYLCSLRPIFERIATGNTIKTIGLPFFKELKVVVPTLGEQKMIGDILWNIDDRIDTENSYLQQLQTLKQGLMQTLLTGKVRVNDSEPSEVSV